MKTRTRLTDRRTPTPAAAPVTTPAPVAGRSFLSPHVTPAPVKVWFRYDKGYTAGWFRVQSELCGGFSIARVAGDGVEHVYPVGTEDDCDEDETGIVAVYGDFADVLRAVYDAEGAEAVLLKVWKEGFDL